MHSYCFQKYALITLLFAAVTLTACTGADRSHALTADGSTPITVMDFKHPLPLDPPPAGWKHRTFWFTSPMDIRFVTKAGRPAIRLATDDSASMLFRHTDIAVSQHPVLAWGWYVQTPIDSDLDETTEAGDDQPARIYLKFRTRDGQEHGVELIWGNRILKAGDWKYLYGKSGEAGFPHYVVRGGNANVGEWHDEKIDLRKLYAENWGDSAGVRLIDVALFCDTDATGAKSVAYFSQITLEPGDPPQNLAPHK